MNDFQTKAVVDSINRMFKRTYFSICELEQLMNVTGATRTPDYKTLRLYHCVDYEEMDAQTKQFVFQATLENVSNVSAFPMLKLFDPAEELKQLQPEPVVNTGLLGGLMRKFREGGA